MLLFTNKIPQVVKTNGAVSVIIPVAPKPIFTNEEKIIAIEIQIKSLHFLPKSAIAQSMALYPISPTLMLIAGSDNINAVKEPKTAAYTA